MKDHYSSSSGDNTSTGEIEMNNAVTNAIGLAALFLQHVANPPRPIYQRVPVERDRAAANERLMKDYFDPIEPRYNEASFRRRFRMSSSERISKEERIANSNFMHNKEAHYALTADFGRALLVKS
ncbi:hypothetical protein QVD17_16055 [Tagetes erecta]|uniref:Uncharacterized protein n=1 Tax=Tagetes erecta TaxID=13708 RepID=A0AAD8KQS8_TARER|nr:hypothetical protein QVD17_16055 [Tagetes erecta]